jgi:hypothetical protein
VTAEVDPELKSGLRTYTFMGYELRSDFMRNLVAEVELALAWRRAVLIVLDARGVQVPEAVREQILACTDLAQLDVWLRRAVTASTADEVIHG